MPGFSLDQREYYRATRELGDWALQAQRAITREMEHGGLSEAQMKAFTNWRKESDQAIRLVTGLRERKIAQHVIDLMAPGGFFGHPIETKESPFYKDFQLIKESQEPNQEETIRADARDFGGREAAAAAYDDAMKE
jgi:hypothetical protein